MLRLAFSTPELGRRVRVLNQLLRENKREFRYVGFDELFKEPFPEITEKELTDLLCYLFSRRFYKRFYDQSSIAHSRFTTLHALDVLLHKSTIRNIVEEKHLEQVMTHMDKLVRIIRIYNKRTDKGKVYYRDRVSDIEISALLTVANIIPTFSITSMKMLERMENTTRRMLAYLNSQRDFYIEKATIALAQNKIWLTHHFQALGMTDVSDLPVDWLTEMVDWESIAPFKTPITQMIPEKDLVEKITQSWGK